MQTILELVALFAVVGGFVYWLRSDGGETLITTDADEVEATVKTDVSTAESDVKKL